MLNLDNAEVYDIETYPNCFTFYMELLNSDTSAVWEISHFRDDRQTLLQHFDYLGRSQTPMIGFNNVHFDYPVIHFILMNPSATVEQIYEKAMSIITSDDNFTHTIWANDRFAPQIDLYKIHHFDNPAKRTSLKALEINMRSQTVVDLPIPVGTQLTQEQIDKLLIPYNGHDVRETKKFAYHSKAALDFRLSLVPQFGVDVMNWNDTKIGEEMIIQRLGKEVCFDYSSGKKKKRQTPRARIALNDIIFPYIQFQNPEFNRVLDHLRTVELNQTDIKEFNGQTGEVLKTKGVLTGLSAHVGGIDFVFGTGGIHASMHRQKIEATDEWLIRDIDVGSLYPNVAISNRLYPEHLGHRFVDVYSELPKDRKKWQAEKGKKCSEANTLKLASNGTYGNSNNIHKVFYDPKFTVTVTVNGQLILCMLSEWLLTVPTLKIIQCNTDGVTYYVHKDHEPQAAHICREWEKYTGLVLEDADYSRVWIRDVNNYIAEDTDGNLKLKGAYWTPDAMDYHGSISESQPPAWHKDLGNLVSTRAAVAAMVHGVDPALFIRMCTNPFDFMCRAKVRRSDMLLWGEQEVQKTGRYFVSKNGSELLKLSPPLGKEGTYKRAAKITQAEYDRVMNEVNWQWDERVCTKNKSVYKTRRSYIQAGYKVTICNDAADFDFNDVNYEWYEQEAKKLIIF